MYIGKKWGHKSRGGYLGEQGALEYGGIHKNSGGHENTWGYTGVQEDT